MKNEDLLKFRQSFCMNQKCMANLLCVSRGHYSKLETGSSKISTDVEKKFKGLKIVSKGIKQKGINAYIELGLKLDNWNYPTFLKRIKNFFKGLFD